MSINVKKYTKDQMAKMVEDAQEKNAALEVEVVELKNCIDAKNDLLAEYANLKAEMQRKNASLTEQIGQMNGEAVNKANEIAKLKADAEDCLMQLKNANDTLDAVSMELQRVNSENDDLRTKLADAEAALGRANDNLAFKGTAIDVMRDKLYNAEQRADYAEAHPWRNLWAWLKRKLGGA